MAARIDLAREAFEHVYSNDLWRLQPDPAPTRRFADLIRRVMDQHNVRSVTEFGCGFWTYAKQIDWTGKQYDGYDVVPGIVQWNNKSHAAPNVRFHVMADDVVPVSADLLVTKDVLQHLPTADVLHYLAMFKKSYRLLLITNDINSADGTNTDITYGAHRGLRLDLPPFNEDAEILDEWVVKICPDYVKRACLLRGRA